MGMGFGWWAVEKWELWAENPITGCGVAKVLKSGDSNFQEGDLVWGMAGWEEYSIVTATQSGILGELFSSHWSACWPICEDVRLLGCYVVGSAGTKEKVDLLKNKFGLDKAFNYKEEKDLVAPLKRLYNLEKTEGVHNLFYLITKRIRMEGFLVSDHYHLYPKYLEMIIPQIKGGNVVYVEDIAEGLENSPKALVGLFYGRNVGKQVVMLSQMGEEVMNNKQIILKHYVEGYPNESDMEFKNSIIKLNVPEGSNVVVLMNLYLSCDPYMRSRMKNLEDSYVESFTPGYPITGCGVAKVLKSGDSNFQEGDIVWGMIGWEEYSIVTPTQSFLFKIHDKNVPLSYYTGILGEYFSDGIDIYFDNVGGKMFDAVLLNMKLRGRIAMCDMISQYNLKKTEGVHNLLSLIAKRIRMEGFIVSDHYHLYPKYLEMIIPQIKGGNIVYVEDIVEGLENAPNALVGLFYGRNVGKQVVMVSRE
ncbi:hypothetical protein H5410_059096 [Solanum commersonii]|uniref:Oxidoreductase N-terminal domain-containing protein n=1 Tax=Solanum commersonii TaxID=4109 RepID=A0A9J5W1L0_SOLCO|nr:hypothetical protein H5410_059096 [Solanum commersonii]